jgi:8-oxo-dGTP pyrophosphatase MutT (NUDIX family)
MTANVTTALKSDAAFGLDRSIIRARLADGLTDTKPWSGLSGDYSASEHIPNEGPVGPPSRPPPSITSVPAPPEVIVNAAVLVALIERDDGYAVLLTERTAHLSKHAGQVAFPGGRMDPEDVDAESCALREAWEETQLDPQKVEVLGRLRPWVTGTGYHITPVVGAVKPPLNLTPQPREVADVFEVPLAFFLDPANHRRVAIDHEGVRRYYYEMPYGDRYIWGATAGMLISLYNALTL